MATVEINATTDEALVEEGREAARRMVRYQLRLGRLALLYAPVGRQGVKSGAHARLREYAEGVEFPFEQLLNMRITAAAWEGSDVGEEEFPFYMLWTLKAVPDKSAVLDMLRNEEPPEQYGRWTVKAAVETARARGMFEAPTWPLERESDRTAAGARPGSRLMAALRSLRQARLTHPRGWQIDRYAEVLDDIQDEVTRLQRELRMSEERRS